MGETFEERLITAKEAISIIGINKNKFFAEVKAHLTPKKYGTTGQRYSLLEALLYKQHGKDFKKWLPDSENQRKAPTLKSAATRTGSTSRYKGVALESLRGQGY